MRLSLAAGLFFFFGALAAGEGGNLIVNPGFEEPGEAPGTASGWTRQILMPEGKAVLRTTRDEATGSTVLETRFTDLSRAAGARFFQHVELQPKSVYKLSYRYRSGWDATLRGDVMLTETGNGIYNIMNCPPNTEWTRIVRYIPVANAEAKQAGVYVQNRTMVPLWYDDLSLEPTDIPLADALDHPFAVTLHPLTEKDVLLMPEQEGELSYIVQAMIPPFVREDAWELDVRVGRGAELARAGVFPLTLDENRSMRIRIPAKLVPAGENAVSVVLRTADGTVYKEGKLAIERMSPELADLDVDFENAPMLADGGENVFPIAWYGVPYGYNQETGAFYWGQGYHEDIKPYAFNVVQNYLFGGWARPGLVPDVKQQTAFLDHAAAEGKKVMVELPRTLVEYDGREKDLEAWLRVMDAHPATLYFRSEEMMHFRQVPLKHLETAARLIREVNPDRKYILFDAATPAMAPYMDGVDIGLSNRLIAVKQRALLGPEKIFLATVNIEWPGRTSPDMDEQRYHTFMPVLHGARGVSFFMWSIARHQATDPDYVHRIGRSVDELAEVARALTHPKPRPDWYPTPAAEGPVSFLRASDGENHWLLAGPSYPNSEGTLHFTLPEGVTARERFSGDAVHGPGGAHAVPVNPLRITILRLEHAP